MQIPAPISGLADSGAAQVVLWQSGRLVQAPALALGLQPLDGDLTALAALTGTGAAVRTGADTWVQRTYPLEQIVGWTNISGSPSVIVISLTSGQGFTTYKLSMEGLRPATDDRRLSLQASVSGVFQTTGYAYSGRVQGFSAGADFGSGADSISASIGLTRVSGSSFAVGNAAGEGYTGEIWFSPFDTAQKRVFQHRGWFVLPDGSTVQDVHGTGVYGSTTAIDGIRLFFNTGDFANTGRYRLDAIRD